MFLDKEYFDGWMQRLSERLERIEKLCEMCIRDRGNLPKPS